MQQLLGAINLTKSLFVSLGAPGLFAVAFLEFFLLPIPPDLVLIPLSATTPELAILYVTVTTVGSVSAGLIGYSIGRKGGHPILKSQFTGERAKRIEQYFDQYGSITVVVGAFAPIPEGYELISIGSGVFGLGTRSYLLASIVGRGGRYSLEALLVVLLGKTAQEFTEVKVYSIIGVVTLVILLVYLLQKRWLTSFLGSVID